MQTTPSWESQSWLEPLIQVDRRTTSLPQFPFAALISSGSERNVPDDIRRFTFGRFRFVSIIMFLARVSIFVRAGCDLHTCENLSTSKTNKRLQNNERWVKCCCVLKCVSGAARSVHMWETYSYKRHTSQRLQKSKTTILLKNLFSECLFVQFNVKGARWREERREAAGETYTKNAVYCLWKSFTSST